MGIASTARSYRKQFFEFKYLSYCPVRLQTAPTVLVVKAWQYIFLLHCKAISSKLMQQFNSAYEEIRAILLSVPL